MSKSYLYTVVGIATKPIKISGIEVGDCVTQYIIETSEEAALAKSDLNEKVVSNVEKLGKDWQ